MYVKKAFIRNINFINRVLFSINQIFINYILDNYYIKIRRFFLSSLFVVQNRSYFLMLARWDY